MKYTPDKITKENLFYTIPIYQRLFEWDTENIVTLLEDLIKEYKHTVRTRRLLHRDVDIYQV